MHGLPHLTIMCVQAPAGIWWILLHVLLLACAATAASDWLEVSHVTGIQAPVALGQPAETNS